MTVEDAITALREAGHVVEPAEGIPGLWNVDGRELTQGQVIDIATKLPKLYPHQKAVLAFAMQNVPVFMAGDLSPGQGITLHGADFGKTKAKTAIHIVNFEQLRSQERRSAALIGTLAHYAVEIGCTVVDDEITCHTIQQSELLQAKWMHLVGCVVESTSLKPSDKPRWSDK